MCKKIMEVTVNVDVNLRSLDTGLLRFSSWDYNLFSCPRSAQQQHRSLSCSEVKIIKFTPGNRAVEILAG